MKRLVFRNIPKFIVGWTAAMLVCSLTAAGVMTLLFLRGRDAGVWLLAAGVLLAAVLAALSAAFAAAIYQPIRRISLTMEEVSLERAPDKVVGDVFDRFNEMLARMKENASREYTAQILKTQAEIHSLQSQINPHFLYNTLETIRSHALSYNVPDIAEMTEALAALFRYSISRPGEMATLAEELENAEKYMLLQQYRFRGRYRYEKQIEEEGVLAGCQLPLLTIQPVVENAVHHGLEPKVGNGEILIRAFRTEKNTVISVSDTGVGMSQDDLDLLRGKLRGGENGVRPSGGKKQGTGIALLNVNQRIRFYFGDEYGLHVTSAEGVGTTVEILLPFLGAESGEGHG